MTPTEGRWLITTSTSEYLIDLDEMWLVRNPGVAIQDEDEGYFIVNELRGDGARVKLHSVGNLELHQSAVFNLTGQAEDPDVVTWRMTTPVRLIAPVAK